MGRASTSRTLWHSATLAARHRRPRPGARKPAVVQLPQPPATLLPMALKSTIYKAQLQISDLDRQVYGEHNLTLALHPSETEERLMVRLLAYALRVPASDQRGTLQFARGLSDTDEPDLWQRDYSDQVVQWIEVGHPDERRIGRACARAEQVMVLAYSASTPLWWAGLQTRVTRWRHLEVWKLEPEQSQTLAQLAQRSMQWQITVQDGQIWVSSAASTVELQPVPLWRGGT